jgi:hypothetical protein
MNIKNFLAAAVLTSFASVVNASTIWAPTNEDTDFLTLSIAGIDLNGAMLAMFDDSDIDTYAGSWLLIGDNVGAEVRFTTSGSDTIANSYTQSGASGVFVDGPLTLTGSSAFTLAVSYDNGSTWLGDTSWETTDSPDAFLIHFDGIHGNAATIGIDLAPVPVPAAVWLFASGLIGMVGVARRRV